MINWIRAIGSIAHYWLANLLKNWLQKWNALEMRHICICIKCNWMCEFRTISKMKIILNPWIISLRIHTAFSGKLHAYNNKKIEWSFMADYYFPSPLRLSLFYTDLIHNGVVDVSKLCHASCLSKEHALAIQTCRIQFGRTSTSHHVCAGDWERCKWQMAFVWS